MSVAEAATTLTSGEPEKWDERWKAIGAGPNRMIFTFGEPITKYEIFHRMYFVDLWCEMLRLPKPCRCLEFGSGRGTTSQYLAASGSRVTLVDLSPNGLDIAIDNFVASGLLKPAVFHEDLLSVQGGEAYDVVHSVGTFEHFDDATLPEVIGRAWGCVRPGGLFWAAVPNGEEGKDGITRSDRTADSYGKLLAAMPGATEVSCKPYRLAPNVYRLAAWKEPDGR